MAHYRHRAIRECEQARAAPELYPALSRVDQDSAGELAVYLEALEAGWPSYEAYLFAQKVRWQEQRDYLVMQGRIDPDDPSTWLTERQHTSRTFYDEFPLMMCISNTGRGG